MINLTLFSRPESYKTMSMEVYTYNLFKNIKNFSGFNVQLFKPEDSKIPLVGKYFTMWLYYPNIVKRQKADVNHILDHSLSHLTDSLDPKRTVITCHDLVGLEEPKSSPFWKRSSFWKNIIRNMLKVRKLIAVSKHTKEDILKYSSYKQKDIVVIYQGIDKNIFKILDRERCRQKFKINKPTILHVGHSNYYKNVEGLIKAMVKLDKDIRFIKVGFLSDSQLNLLRNFKIDFMQFEYLCQEEIVEVYNAIDLLVYPSWHEGFGFPVIEAMACGCPVVCSNVSCLPEIVGEAAVMVSPDDISGMAKAIGRVLESEQLRIELIQKGLRQVRKFSWEDTARETIDVYNEIA